jgi:hypothetical protein
VSASVVPLRAVDGDEPTRAGWLAVLAAAVEAHDH